MEYRGKLYAKIGKKFIELDKTTEDWAKLQTELKEAKERIDELIINQNDVLLQLEKNESMTDFVIATETVRILLTK